MIYTLKIRSSYVIHASLIKFQSDVNVTYDFVTHTTHHRSMEEFGIFKEQTKASIFATL